MRTRSLAELEAEIRLLTDTEGDEHVTSEDIRLLVNQALPELHEMLARADANRFLATASVSTTAGTALYSLPSDFMSVQSVWLIEGDTRRQIDRFEPLERSYWTGANRSDYYSTRYTIRGHGESTQIEFDPDPGTQSYTVYYLQGPGTYTTEVDTIDYTSGWEAFVVNAVAAKIAVREESDPTPFLADRDAAARRIQHMARHRDSGQPPTVQDVYRGRQWRPRLPYP